MAPPVRILCFHGYRQNAQVFYQKLGALRKALRSDEVEVELVPLDAPITVETSTTSHSSIDEKVERSWWLAKDKANGGVMYKDWKPSIEYIFDFAAQCTSPFYGLLGFSQGAALVAVLLGLLEKPDTSSALKLEVPPALQSVRFGILISGFPPRDTELHSIVCSSEVKLTTPTLHVYGTSDALVEPESTKALMRAWTRSSAHTFVHDKGHLIPFFRPFLQTVREFINKHSVNEKNETVTGD